MPAEAQEFDAYEVVLADLRAKREQIDQAIKAIEGLRGLSVQSLAMAPPAAGAGGGSVDDPGAFLGMTIPDAAKKLLAAKRKPLNNPEMAGAFRAGGLHLNSKDPVNTIGAVITRRSKEVGDIVKVGRGTWGLKEWYPNRSFKTKPKTKDAADDDLSDILGEGGES
ncbi:MAG: winged helix-turn-helix domain-containing protein [Alphaproteobacteria bacterium]|nr:winged helix-turn-helix domain-containing protein [Alphaproteobacteria bacterium]MBV9692855.1 winged helix-turn-helix domain-containing protein [Alphaproteobacteria bacterium]